MRKVLTILTLTVAGTLLSADESSAQWRRRGGTAAYTYPTYTYPTYTSGYTYPTYTYGTTGVQLASPITTVSGNTAIYGSQPVYNTGYYPAYNPGYYPTYNSGYYNSGYNSGYYPAYNSGYYNSGAQYYSNAAQQLGSWIQSWIR